MLGSSVMSLWGHSIHNMCKVRVPVRARWTSGIRCFNEALMAKLDSSGEEWISQDVDKYKTKDLTTATTRYL